MKKIIVYDIEGLPSSKIGYEKDMYTFSEMISFEHYDVEELEIHKDIQERDYPSGWVIQSYEEGVYVFIPVFDFEQWEEPKTKRIHKCNGNCKNCTGIH